MEKVYIHCDIYHRNDKVARLEITDGKLVKYEVFTAKMIKTPCPKNTSLQNLLTMLTSRVIPPERCNRDTLKYLGLKNYNAFKILRKTHGVDMDDFIWFKFDGEEITWEDVKVREVI